MINNKTEKQSYFRENSLFFLLWTINLTENFLFKLNTKRFCFWSLIYFRSSTENWAKVLYSWWDHHEWRLSGKFKTLIVYQWCSVLGGEVEENKLERNSELPFRLSEVQWWWKHCQWEAEKLPDSRVQRIQKDSKWPKSKKKWNWNEIQKGSCKHANVIKYFVKGKRKIEFHCWKINPPELNT